ncbi:MAG: division/cell wall cluster transcriptional repressor MraZ [Actinomycetia bacterium]|nr:division/cell wall cluster transcriptional repressor MraZ [Actinomycetes bacterium]
MFTSTYTPKIDEKGRFFLPAKYREQLAKGLIIAPFHDECLAIYPIATFQAKAERIAAMPDSVSKVREFQRQMAGDACDEVPDKQGRVHIPGYLREYAHLSGQIVVRGVIDRIELWDPKRWEAHSAAQRQAYSTMDAEIWPEREPGPARG